MFVQPFDLRTSLGEHALIPEVSGIDQLFSGSRERGLDDVGSRAVQEPQGGNPLLLQKNPVQGGGVGGAGVLGHGIPLPPGATGHRLHEVALPRPGAALDDVEATGAFLVEYVVIIVTESPAGIRGGKIAAGGGFVHEDFSFRMGFPSQTMQDGADL